MDRTCKDCLHYELCIHLSIANIGKDVDVACALFKDKSLCIDLPCVSECKIYYDLISDFGKTLFLSREDAEIALEANKNEKV